MKQKLNYGLLTRLGSLQIFGHTGEIGKPVYFHPTTTDIADNVYEGKNELFKLGGHVSYGNDINKYGIFVSPLMNQGEDNG